MMKKWIAQWLGATDAAATEAPGGQQRADAAMQPPGQRHADVAAAFYRWLAGQGGMTAPAQTEALVLGQLGRLAHDPEQAAALVPRVPEVIPQLLRSLRDENQSGAELARQVAQDIVLVAEVIREANSPYYRSTGPVRSIDGALMLLGQNGLRMLLARVAFRPILSIQSGRFARLVAPRIWSQSEKCAMAASLLAPHAGVDPFEAYLAGLVQNVGLIVALRLMEQTCPDDVLPQSDEFCAGLLACTQAMAANIAREWELPAGVEYAIREAGRDGAAPLARLLADAGLLASLRVMLDAGEYDAGEPSALQGLDAFQLRCFDKLRTEED